MRRVSSRTVPHKNDSQTVAVLVELVIRKILDSLCFFGLADDKDGADNQNDDVHQRNDTGNVPNEEYQNEYEFTIMNLRLPRSIVRLAYVVLHLYIASLKV